MRLSNIALAVSLILVSSALVLPQASVATSGNTQSIGLPQSPVTPKERSDLEDEGIKGKVHTIRNETESFYGTYVGKGRRLGRIEEFNEQGNFVAVNYPRDGSKGSVILYGYIDGDRVSKSEGESEGIGSGIVDPKPRDKRYDFKRRYKYEGGKLVEQILVSNDGSLWLTDKYNYKAGEKEVLIYDNKGKLNQKYLHKYDKDGNETDYFVFDAFKDPNEVTLKGRYTYGGFDSKRNWTQRTLSYARTRDGVESFEPYETVYRSITYYP